MFRDSFANTLIPFFSNAFENAYYSKGEPNSMESLVETHNPDFVVIQKVERNISKYLESPPILTPPTAELPNKLTIANTDTTLETDFCMYDANYYQISGELDTNRMEPEAQVLVAVDGTVYRAYLTGENGYLLYLKADAFANAQAEVEVYILNPRKCIQALATEVKLPQYV